MILLHKRTKLQKNVNDYFISIPITDMRTNQEYECFYSSEEDFVLKIIEKYQNNPSIKAN